jgi:hypothetical protein
MNLLQEWKLLAKIPNLTGLYKLAKAQVRDKKKKHHKFGSVSSFNIVVQLTDETSTQLISIKRNITSSLGYLPYERKLK